ncbi:MAG TPA: YceI family protein [Leucothrix mucor]|nr:YceI family protein [Leucothrix mucor]
MLNRKNIISLFCGTILLGASSVSLADMTLNSDRSSLSFFSVKKGTAGESHTIPKLSGTFSDAGDLKVTLDLKTVDTKNKVRDERMNKFLFETDKHPKATLTAKITDDLSGDGLKAIEVEATLMMHGVEKKIKVAVAVIRVGDKLIASSTKPVIISAPDFKLGEGVAKLQELAKLPSVALSVPVSFVLVFDK